LLQKNVFWDTKNRLRAFQRQELPRQPLKSTECNLALFFIFFRFCAELNLWGLLLAKAEAARCRFLYAHMIVKITISPLPIFVAAVAFGAGRQLLNHIRRELKARYHCKENLI
jgi:hypothetical protein